MYGNNRHGLAKIMTNHNESAKFQKYELYKHINYLDFN